jgi:hypothetical protein
MRATIFDWLSGMQSMKKYSEEVVRYPAVNSQGKPCEILERITQGRDLQPDGSLSAPEVVNRRYDLKTGESLNRISDTEFEDDQTGERIRLRT